MSFFYGESPTEPVEEIVLDDPFPDSKDEIITVPTKSKKTSQQPTQSKSLLKKNVCLRGLLPHERDKDFSKIFNSPIVKRCCIEHGYFLRNRVRNSRYNFRNLPSNGTNTLQFENEQLTIDVERLASKLKTVYMKDSSNKHNVINKREKKVLSCSSSSSNSDRNSPVDNLNDRDYCPENTTTESDTDVASVDSCHSVKEIRKTNFKTVSKNDSKKSNLKGSGASRIPIKFYKVNDYFDKLEVMQKLIKAKGINEKGKSGKNSPPVLKKMISQRKSENILKMSDYLFPMPNLTKMVNGGKNWKMEYMDNEVQNFGLDDLLLKASELNAENFTKALGRKLEPMKMNFNNKDSSEIVFTIPKSKKSSEDGCENDNDFPKRNNLKTIKLDISKPFFESDKPKDDEVNKPPEEVSPKKPGIKVKTVENINEEFKDSLGRLNGIDKDISVGLDRTSFGVSIKEPEREKNSHEESEKDVEGSRPFIMTIIQSKTEKQRPAILRNSYLKKKGNAEKRERMDKGADSRVECEMFPRGDFSENEKIEENVDVRSLNSQILEKSFNRNLCGEEYVSYPKIFDDSESEKNHDGEGRFIVKKRNIPFILNHSRKTRQNESISGSKTPNKLVKVNEGSDKQLSSEKAFKITSIEQKLGPKETNRRFIKVVPYEPVNKSGQPTKGNELHKISDEEIESPQKDEKISHVLSLTAFSTILKEILPEKWFLCLDKKHGLQIIKTNMDESLNPSILISVVIARCGKLTVNVRGKQLPKTHELFSNICDISNSENKLSLNYVLAILNKLRHRSVCFGCDDPSLKKYWSGDGFIENQTESQQVYRSHLCQLLVSLGKRRCYPCYRMNESLKKRYRRDKLCAKAKEEKERESKEVIEEEQQQPSEQTPKTHLQPRGLKRNLEDFLEESFSTMKQQIVDEIEKNKKLGERENALKAQEEVLSFMGLTRKESLDNPVRKSKRKKNSFYKLQQPVKKKTDQKELEFLEKYWTDINTLFSTSLLFGAYSRTGRGRLREKCRMFQKLLSTWKNIVTSNPEWIGEISFPDELTNGENTLGKESAADQFEKMDVPALRAYIINSVKEVNRIKHKLRTRNSYFKALYNKFVKRRMKRPKTLGSNSQKGTGSCTTSTTNTPTPTDFSSDENSRDKDKITTDDNPPAVSVTNCETEDGGS